MTSDDKRKIDAADQIKGLETQLMHLRVLHGMRAVPPVLNCFYKTANKAIIFICATGESCLDPSAIHFLKHIKGIKESVDEREDAELIIPEEVERRVVELETCKDTLMGVVIFPSEVPDGPKPGQMLHYRSDGVYHSGAQLNFIELGMTLVECIGHISMLGVNT